MLGRKELAAGIGNRQIWEADVVKSILEFFSGARNFPAALPMVTDPRADCTVCNCVKLHLENFTKRIKETPELSTVTEMTGNSAEMTVFFLLV